MFLSKLTIQGFKSFSDRTELNFSEGVTAIVGPNGCGKTNIVDAIRWVLGEQKSSVLRSNKMEDVIFNGTQKIKPLGFCEAIITIENNRGLLPIEYNTVEICRRYYRSGESEYYINKTPCRLKDIHEMFIDTGMSSGAYSVIELKMIESILSQNPTDRRTMFDEASGINNYNKQRAASTRRLISTKSDMERINDIMLEVGANVKNLRLQMKRYDRHSLLSSELINCEYLFYKKNLDTIEKDLDPIKKIFSSKIKFRDTFHQELEKKELFLDNIQKKFEKTKMNMEKIQSEEKRKEEEIVSANQEVIISTEQIGHSRNRIEHFKNEINDKKHLIKVVKDEIGKMKKSLHEIIPEIKKKEKEFRQLEEKLLKLNNTLKEVENEDRIKRDELNDNIKKIISIKNLIETNKKIILEKESSILRINKNININLEKDGNSIKNLKKLLEDLDKMKHKDTIKKKEINRLNKRSQILAKESIELLNMKYKNEANLKRAESEFNFYEKIMVSKEGSCDGNDYIIKNMNKYKNVLGKVSDLIVVPKHLVNSVSICLGRLSDFLIIKTFSDVEKILSSIPKNMSLNFIILDRINNDKLKKITKSHLIYNLKYGSTLKSLYLHLLGNFILVDSLEDIKNTNDSYITLDGDIFNHSGLYQIKPNKNESPMFIKSELEKIKGSIRDYKKEIDINNQKIKSMNKEKEKISSDLISLNIQIEDNRKNMNELSVKIEHSKFISSEFQNQNRSSRDLAKKFEKEIINMKIEDKNKTVELKSSDLNSLSINKKIETLANKIHDKKNIILELRQKIQSKNIKLVEFTNKSKGLEDRIGDHRVNFENINRDMNRYGQEIIKLQGLIKKLNSSVLNSKKMINKLYADQKKLNISEKKLHKQYTNEYRIFQEYQSEIKDKRVVKDQNVEEMNKLELAISQLKSKRDYHSELLTGIDKDSLSNSNLEKFKEFTTSEISKKIESIKKSIDRIGPINMDVNSQHKAEIERFDFLTNQYDDLVKAEDSLQKTINKLDTEARKMFLDTFKKINKNFKKTYNMFYKDAKANLELKGEDVLESEIVIKATPPGKSTQSLRMLSGGEKAITAIALLFAIYLVKPSPFCILDEVDAPLDDINIVRFNSVLKEFSQNTQFVVVTHNKLTMERSDYLYGVTQQRKGISKVVSVNLVDIDKRKTA